MRIECPALVVARKARPFQGNVPRQYVAAASQAAKEYQFAYDMKAI